MTLLNAYQVSLFTTPLAALSWKAWLWGGITFATVIMAAAALAILLPRRRKHAQRRLRVIIENEGNVRTRYRLHADCLEGGLDFDFLLNGVYLPELSTITTTDVTRQVPTDPYAQGAQGLSYRPSGADAGKAKKSVKFLMVLGNLAADILSTVGSLLPRSAGGPMMLLSMRLRQGQGSVQRVQQLSKSVGSVAGQAKAIPTDSSGAPSAPVYTAPQSSSRATSSSYVKVQEKKQTIVPGWYQTPFVEPGETLILDLVVTPPPPYKTQQRAYKIISQSLEQPKAVPVIQEDLINLPGLTFFQRYAPFIGVLLAAGAIFFVTFLVTSTGV